MIQKLHGDGVAYGAVVGHINKVIQRPTFWYLRFDGLP